MLASTLLLLVYVLLWKPFRASFDNALGAFSLIELGLLFFLSAAFCFF